MRYVAIGDSLSEGIGDSPWPDGSARGWTDRLAALLKSEYGALDYANLAMRGYTARQVLDRQVDAAVALAPDVVTITAGMNDILRPRADFVALKSTLTELVRPFRAMQAKVLLVPIPDVTGISPAGRLVNSRRLRLNEMNRQLCDELGVVPLVGSESPFFQDPRAWADDRLHLSPVGHERLAAAAADALGVATAPSHTPLPSGAAPARTLRTDAEWWWHYVVPWVGRHLRGRSSGDGRTAKRPMLTAVDSPG